MRTIGVVTSSRADYGIYRPILKAIAATPDLKLSIVVTGMHLNTDGDSLKEIERDGFSVSERVATVASTNTPKGVADAIATGVAGFAELFAGRWRPDFLLVLGDRFDMYPAVLAALPFGIPIAHVHGGEITEGAFDDTIRHSITKFAHLHFVATDKYGDRVAQLGEESWRITVAGAPSLDNLATLDRVTDEELCKYFGWDIPEHPLIVTYHPVTLEYKEANRQISALLAALAERPEPIVFTAPNSDPGSREIRVAIEDFVAKHPRARFVVNLGTRLYFGLMRIAVAMIGNSSSGIIESASFELPVVNIGIRQKGRVRGANVIDVCDSISDIRAGIVRATDPGFRRSLVGISNPYGRKDAGRTIAHVLSNVKLDERLLVKRFADIPAASM